MSDVVGFLEGIEKLAYKILVWIILIPKTLWRIIFNPDWVPAYVNVELKKEKSAFDEYISPIILLLVVALIPTLIIFILPDFNLSISSPAEAEPTTERILRFDAEATFVSGSNKMRDQYTWYVEVIDTDPTGSLVYDEYGYLTYREIYRETYSELTNTTTIIHADRPEQTEVSYRQENTYLTRNENSSKDEFYYPFETPGSYFVNVEVVRFDTNRQDVSVEGYGGTTYMYVFVPADGAGSISITNYAPKVQSLEWSDVFSDRNTIFLALALLTPPLLFAFAVRVLTREKVSENSLKENFYVQCYYFSPLSLTFWATFYGFYFYTIDIFSYNDFYKLTMWLPLTWAALWFIYAESYAVAVALRTSVWKAFSVVLACIFIMIGLVSISIYLLLYDQNDSLRKGLIWAYPLVFHLALLGLILIRFIGWTAGLTKLSFRDVILFLLFLPSMFVFVGGNLLGVLALPEVASPTPTTLWVLPPQSTATTVPQIPVSGDVAPVETGVPITLPISPGKPSTYVLHKGEFPYCIARRFDVHPAQLLAASGLADGSAVPSGSTLSIPESGSPFPGDRSLRNHPTTYVVSASHETLYSIACLFGDVDPGMIAAANQIPIEAALVIGQSLQIP